MTQSIEIREQWLNGAIAFIKRKAFNTNYSWPQIRITMSQQKGGKQISSFNLPSDSLDNTHEIYISVHTSDSAQILRDITFQLITAYTGTKSLKGEFCEIAKRVGITRPYSAPLAFVTPTLQNTLDDIHAALGDIPHAPVEYKPKSKGRSNSTINCSHCGFKANTSNKWATQVIQSTQCPVCADPHSLTVNIK